MTSFIPSASTRTSTPLAAYRMLFQVNVDQLAIQGLQRQLSTGYRFEKPSEDPSSAIKVLSSQREQEFRTQTQVNLKQADSILSITETNLAETQNLLNQLRSTAVEAAGNTLSSDQRTALLHRVDGILRRITDLANSKFGDQYIFSGSNVRSAPVSLTNDTIRYLANDERLNTLADFGSIMAANVTAQEVFGVVSNEVTGTVDLNPALDRDTTLSSLNHGSGVRRGVVKFSSGVASQELDIANVHNLGEVIDKIADIDLGGRRLTASLTATGIQIDYVDGLGGILRVEDVGAGSASRDLGINNVNLGSQSPVAGTDLNPILTAATKVTQLLGGAGLANADSMRIIQGDVSYVINTNSLTTVEDLLNRIKQSGARVSAGIDPTGRFLTVQSLESGTQLSIGENGGTLAADLGLRTLTRHSPVSRLNNGQGIFLNSTGDDLLITRNDGTEMRVDLTGVQTVGDVIDRINNHVDNFNLTTRVQASLSTVGNGLVLSSPTGAQPIAVTNAGGSQAATGLGWTNKNQLTAQGTVSGTQSVITGSDVSSVEVEGAFTSMLKLRRAIANQDFEAMQAVGASLDQDLERLSIARGIVGVRQEDISSRLQKSEDEVVQLKQVESDNRDADLAQVISELTARQAAMTASLQLLGQTARTTLFDYL